MSLVELAIWVSEGNITYRKSLFLSECLIRLHDELVQELVVSVVVADGHHDHTTWFQLIDEGLRYSG